MEEIIKFSLTGANATDPLLLISMKDRDLGTEPDIVKDQIEISLGSRPISLNLFETSQKTGKKIPPEIKIFDEYDVWLITYTVGVMKHGGWDKVKKIGLEINYPDRPNDPRITIQSCIPNTEFKRLARGAAEFSSGLSLDGNLKAVIKDIKVDEFIELGAHAKLNLTAKAQSSLNLTFSIMSSYIIAIGQGDTKGQWEITKDEKPLLGSQSFSHTIITPKNLKKLKVKSRVTAVITGPFGNSAVKLIGPWVDLDCISKAGK